MCLCVVHELGEVGVLAFLCLLGRGDDVDGVDQLCNGAQLFLEIHGQDLLQVQHDVGLGAQNVSITVSGLLAGKVDAVCAACTFDVDDLNRNTQDGLQHGLQGAQGAVSTAADAPGADQRDLALPGPVGSSGRCRSGTGGGRSGSRRTGTAAGSQAQSSGRNASGLQKVAAGDHLFHNVFLLVFWTTFSGSAGGLSVPPLLLLALF